MMNMAIVSLKWIFFKNKSFRKKPKHIKTGININKKILSANRLHFDCKVLLLNMKK